MIVKASGRFIQSNSTFIVWGLDKLSHGTTCGSITKTEKDGLSIQIAAEVSVYYQAEQAPE